MSANYKGLFENWELAVSRKLVRQFRSRWASLGRDEFDELMQECLVHWLSVRSQFDPALDTNRSAFIARVVRNKLTDLVRERKSEKRKASFISISLDQPLGNQEDSPTLLDLVNESQVQQSVAIVTIFVGVIAWFDGLRALGPIAGVEPMRLVNIIFTLVLASTGPIMWARTSQRFRHVQWLRHPAFGWTHRLVGLGYLPLILLWDFYFETGDEGGSEMALLEAINKPVLIALLASAAFLFLKWPRPLLRYYPAIKYFHIVVATIYVLKFFAEPLLGGKLG